MLPQRNPLAPVRCVTAWVHRPVLPSKTHPDGLPGLLLIDATPYLVTVLAETGTDGKPKLTGWRLTKSDGAIYDLCFDPSLESCDCPDGTFRPERPGGCKHSVAVKAALESIGISPSPLLPPPMLPIRCGRDARHHPECVPGYLEGGDDYDPAA